MTTTQEQHSLREAAVYPAAPILLPNVIEQAACQVFEQFGQRLRAGLNGREQRALKLALDGHVAHKTKRIFSVRSEDNRRGYLVDLDRRFCSCPDSRGGHVCKHRIAAYLIEQAQKASSEFTGAAENFPTLENPPRVSEPGSCQPDVDMLERARFVLQRARSEALRQAIVYAAIYHGDEALPVEVVGFDGDTALVRALPEYQNGKVIPCFPFEGRQASARVLAGSLFDIHIYR